MADTLVVITSSDTSKSSRVSLSGPAHRIHRSYVDGLRGLCVLAIVLFHLDERLLPGGFVGVDAFFVISGFLISGNLMGELESSGGQLSLMRFYAARARRIAPAVLVMLALNLFVALLLLPAALPVAKSTIASALSLSNVYQTYGLTHGYFGADARMDPLTHLWCVCVRVLRVCVT